MVLFDAFSRTSVLIISDEMSNVKGQLLHFVAVVEGDAEVFGTCVVVGHSGSVVSVVHGYSSVIV